MSTYQVRKAATRLLLGAFASVVLAACGGAEVASTNPNSPSVGGSQPPPSPPAINRAPQLSGNPAGTVTAGQTYSFVPNASDPDGNSLAFSVAGKPAWLAFNTTTGALTGTPAATDAGQSTITISASDGSLQASLTFALTVIVTANRAPTIAGSGNGALLVGQAYTFTPTASDPDGDRLTFGISGRPSWAAFDPATGTLSGTPGAGDVGTSNVTISVSDGSLQASIGFAIVVSTTPPPPPPANRAPTIGGTGAATVSTGQVYSFTPTASDPDGNALTFAVSGRPAWATFSTTTGRLQGTPAVGDVGTSTVTIAVTDGALSASMTFTITVISGNRAPTISGNGGRSVAVGDPYSFTPTASDPDGNALTFSATGRPAWLSLNTSTGTLTGTPAAGDVGSSTVTLTVSDGSMSAAMSFTITVVTGNRAPTISGSGTQSATVGQAFAFTPTASDPDGSPLTFSATGRPSWLSLNASTGALTGTPAAGDVGTSNVTITVSDGTLSASLPITLTVAAAPNRAPTISGNGTQSATVGQAFAFTPTASDPDGSPLTFSATGRPAWLSVNTSTGTLTGTPAAGDVGISNVTITVSDGTLSASLPITLTVAAAPNRAPTISGNGTQSATVGQAFAFTPTASDPDGSPLTFSATGRPAWLALNTSTGALTGTPATGDVGTATVTLTVSDGALSASLTVTITVTAAANRAPTISGNGTRTVTVGQAYSFTPTASDPDGNPLTFSATGRPAWLSLNTSTGALTGTPAAGDVGTATVTLTVSDGTLSASLTVTITVAAVANGSATLTWTPPTTRSDGTALSNLASYRVYYGTQSASLTSRIDVTNPGVASYVVTNLAPGTWYFAVTAVDSTGAESDRSNVASATIN